MILDMRKILDSMEATMNDIEEYEEFRTVKVLYFIAFLVLALIGVTLVLYEQGLTYIFESSRPRQKKTQYFLLSFAGVLFVPIICWFIYAFFPPCKNERERRRTLRAKFKQRDHAEKKRFAYKWGKIDPDEFQLLKKQKAEEEERLKLEKQMRMNMPLKIPVSRMLNRTSVIQKSLKDFDNDYDDVP